MILAGVIVAGPKEKIETLELRKACEVTEVLTSGSEHENSILSELTIFCSCVTPTDAMVAGLLRETRKIGTL